MSLAYRLAGCLWAGLFIFLAACDGKSKEPGPGPSYLYVGTSATSGDRVDFGAVVTEREGGLALRRLLGGRDSLIDQSLSILGGEDSRALISLAGDTLRLPAGQLYRQPYLFTYGDATYWMSFEPTFTGFPEFAREGARDLVSHPTDWDPRDDLPYTEFSLINDYARPILLFGSRQRGQYVANLLVVVDSLSEGIFSGRAFTDGGGLGERVRFRPLSSTTIDRSAADLVDSVNEGYSRSSLRWQPVAADFSAQLGLPRRATIDRGDLRGISASFLSGSEFMLLSDDHVILQGSYVLDLDKNLLTVTEEDGLIYRVFLAREADNLSLTVPVSVVELIDSELRGADNYLHLEVVE